MKFFDRTKKQDFSPIGELRLIQTQDVGRCFCDVKACTNSGFVMHSDSSHKAFIVCVTHQNDGVESGLLMAIPQNEPGKPRVPVYFEYDSYGEVTKGAQR